MQRQQQVDGLILRIERMTKECRHGCHKALVNLASSNQVNAVVICDYIDCVTHEVNPSIHHKMANIMTLCQFSRFFDNRKIFKKMSRQDVLSYLDSCRKSEEEDAQHQWIGTYNAKVTRINVFMKWLFYPNIERTRRPIPAATQNIPLLQRKEVSIYKPTDMWEEEEHALFLKYCPSIRNKCYHAMAKDTAARPHELLKLKNKDILFLISPTGIQYSMITVNGKTGSREVPLVNSIPYIKAWWSEHPLGDNPDNIFLCAFDRSLGKRLSVSALEIAYSKYKKEYFPKLLQRPDVPEEEKRLLRGLLAKPWNPYIQRHSRLTELAPILTGTTLSQHAGWSLNSKMVIKYVHYYGHESSNALLKAQGIVPQGKEKADILKPKQCPNCNASNKPDAKFCPSCKTVLSYDGFDEMLRERKDLNEQMRTMRESVDDLNRWKRASARAAADPGIIEPHYTVEPETPALPDKEEQKRQLMATIEKAKAELDKLD